MWIGKYTIFSEVFHCVVPLGNEMGWAYGAYGWGEGVYRVLVGKPKVKRLLGRLRRRWVDNIRIDVQEVGCGYMDWIGLVQGRDSWQMLVSAVMNLRVPWNARNFLTSCKPVSFSRRTLHHGVSKLVPLGKCRNNGFNDGIKACFYTIRCSLPSCNSTLSVNQFNVS